MPKESGSEPKGALFGLKVLDLAGPIGVYCTKALADLGADVIRVEPPRGDAMRELGPFYGDSPDPEKSLYWWHYNTSKRSVTLDIEKPEGHEVFKRLVQWADVVVETFEPGYLDRLGLGYEALRAINPRVIVTSITPFGQTGPYAHFKAPDIVGQAMSGLLSTVGPPDRPPYPVASENGYWAAGCLAANGTMLALHFRAAGGGGQHVDVSMQEAITLGIGNSMPTYDVLGQVYRRGQGISQAVGAVRNIFRCKDGHVFFMAAAPGTKIEWVRDLLMEHGLGEEFDPKWLDVPKMRDNPVERQRFEDLMLRFFARFTKWELMDMGFNREKRVFMVSLDTAKDVVNSPQLKARGFFREVEHPELGKSFRYAGPPYPLPASPATISRRAPLIGEHNQEVYGHVLGMTTEEMRRLQQERVI